MDFFKYLVVLLSTLFLSHSVYASVTELNAYDVDKCRQQLRDSHIVNLAAVLVYSKDTNPNALKLFKTLSEERPSTPFFQFNLDTDSLVNHDVSRLCLGQLYDLYDETLIILGIREDINNIAFQAMGFGRSGGMLSNKAKIEAVIDDINDSDFLAKIKK